MKDRREFLKISALGSLSMMLLSSFETDMFGVDRKKFGVGLQLYTVRDAISADLNGSMKKLSDLGYKNVELAGYSGGKFYGLKPAEFKKMINDLDMEIISSHTMVEAKGVTLDNAKIMADAHAEIGIKYCIQPWVNPEDRKIDTYKRMIGDWNKVGEIMKNVGIQFGYHNHNFEFKNVDGIVPYYDVFIPEMDKDLITLELDLFWASKAGQDPVEMFEKYPGRFQLLHLKDMKTQEDPFFEVQKDDITNVGDGVIDFKRILAAKKTAGVKYTFVEDDNQGNGKPFEGVGKSIENLVTDILK